jgi:ribonuclease D
MPHPIPEPVLVTAREHLEEIIEELHGAGRLAADTESNGFYAYREKVCLLQISTPQVDYIIDPIAITDLSSLAPIMADPTVEKIFHAGEYDILCLKRDYGFAFENVFDTMIAERLLGVKELGLAAAIEKHFGVRLSKKLQRADWGRRPLNPEQIRYAQLDTHYLMRLSDIQRKLLKDKGRLEDAQEAFLELAAVEPSIKVFDPEGFWRLPGKQGLSERQMAVLKEIYLFREEAAQAKNRAPFRVMPESLMVHLAEESPKTLNDLDRIRGITPYLSERYGPALIKAIERGLKSRPLEPPRPSRSQREFRERRLFEELRAWRKTQAAQEGVEPVVILSGETLNVIAHLSLEGTDPLKPLSPLKKSRYGAVLTALLNRHLKASDGH